MFLNFKFNSSEKLREVQVLTDTGLDVSALRGRVLLFWLVKPVLQVQ